MTKPIPTPTADDRARVLLALTLGSLREGALAAVYLSLITRRLSVAGTVTGAGDGAGSSQ